MATSTKRLASILCLIPLLTQASAVLGQGPAAKEQPPAGVTRLGSVHLRQMRSISLASLAQDGKFIAAHGWDNLFCLWDAADGKLLFSQPHSMREHLFGQALSHDGKWLAVCGQKNVYLWDIARRERRTLPTVDQGLHQPIFSPNSKVLAVPSYAGPLRLFDVASGELLRILPCDGMNGGLDFTPDSKMLVTAESWAVLRFWGVADGKKLREIELKDDHYAVDGLAVSPDGKHLAVNQSGAIAQSSMPEKPRHFRMLELETGKELYRLEQNDANGWVCRNAFTPDGKHLVRSVHDYRDPSKACLELLEPMTGKVVRSIPRPGGQRGIQFSADGKKLMTMEYGYENRNVVRLWSFPEFKELLPHTGHTAETSSLAFSADGKTLCSSGSDHKVIFWDLATGQPRHEWSIMAWCWWREVLLCPDGKHFVCLMNHVSANRNQATEGKALVCKVETGELVHKLEPIRGAAALSPDGKTLAAADSGHHIRLWNILTGKEIARLKGNDDDPSSVAFSPDGQMLAATSDGSLRIWWTATGRLFRTIKYGFSLPRNGAPRLFQKADLAFSAEGTFISVTTFAKAIEVWDLLDGTKVQTTDRLKAPLFRHFALLDNRFIVKKALPFEGGEPVLIDTFRSRPLGPLPSWARQTEVLAVSQDGKMLAASDLHGLVHFARTADVMKAAAPVALPAQRIAGLWTNLRLHSEVGLQAYRDLAEGDKEVVAFLGAKLRPVQGPDAKDLTRWLKELDDKNGQVCEQANRELEAWGPAVELSLRRAYEGCGEPGRALTRELLTKIEAKLSDADTVQNLRAAGVLAAIGTQEAREVLRQLAQGATGSRITETARLALAR